MTQSRLSLPAATSLVLHIGAAILFVRLSHLPNRAQGRTIDNVDLLVQRNLAVPRPAAQRRSPMMDLLKLSVPTMPKLAPQLAQPHMPEIKKPRLAPLAPRLDERSQAPKMPRISTLDLSERRAGVIQMPAQVEENHHLTQLAKLPVLEDIGVRRAPNLPAAIKLDEQRQHAADALQAIRTGAALPTRSVPVTAEALREAAPSAPAMLGRILPSAPPFSEPPALGPQGLGGPAPVLKPIVSAAPAPLARRGAAQPTEKKKPILLEGPLVGREVLHSEIPRFPEWARQQGIIEAEVVVLFYVDPEGNVLPDMTVQSTSGYGRLDRLAESSLRDWKFAAIGSSERQWGRITFRFILE